jgi:hypothetical protein
MEALQDLWTGAGLNAIEGPGVYYTHPHHLRDGHAILLALAARFRQDKEPIAGIKEFDAGSFESSFHELGATLIVSYRSPWRFCGGLLSRQAVDFARCQAQRSALQRLW